MIQDNGHVVLKKIMPQQDILFLQNIFFKSVNKQLSISSFNDILSIDSAKLNLTTLNKEIVYSYDFFKFINSDFFYSLINEYIGKASYDLHPALNIRIQSPSNLNTQSKFSRYLDWHQDIYTMSNKSVDTPIFTIWIPLSDCNFINGGLDLFKLSSKIMTSLAFNDVTYFTEKDEIDNLDGEILSVESDVGDLVIFDKYMIHKSRQNLSINNRISLDVRVFLSKMPSGRENLDTYAISPKANKDIYEKWIGTNKTILNI